MKEISTIEIFAIKYLRSIQALYGFNLAECQINWAITQMLQGVHSLSLFALAGMAVLDNPFEINQYFLQALNELKIEIPSQKEAVKNYVMLICKKMTTHILSEHIGCELLANICIDLDYQVYHDWYQLLDEKEAGLITSTEFKKIVQKKALALLA